MDHTLRPPGPAAPENALAVEDQFYAYLAGGARHQLLLAAVDVGLQWTLAGGPLSLDAITQRLSLDGTRTDKWMSLLVGVGLCEQCPAIDGGPPTYAAGPLLRALAAPDLEGGYFYREFLRYWRASIAWPTVDVLRGMPVPYQVRYPPTDAADTRLLHEWMRSGALLTLSSLEKQYDFGARRRLLDVGGGDATMACALVGKHPALHVTVFNVPQAAYLARQNVAAQWLGERVSIVVGDFRADPLPQGFDTVLFSRVLADWPPDLCRRLIEQAFAALEPGGQLVVCEPLRDHNLDLSIAWEHSYLPYDDFGPYTYKMGSVYEELMFEAGFREIARHPRAELIHGVIIGTRPA